MTRIYRHRQTGTVTVVVTGATLLLMACIWISVPAAPAGARNILSAVGILVLVLLFVFGSLTVSVDAGKVEFWFGPGVLRKRFEIGRILEAKAVRNRWVVRLGHPRHPGWLALQRVRA